MGLRRLIRIFGAWLFPSYKYVACCIVLLNSTPFLLGQNFSNLYVNKVLSLANEHRWWVTILLTFYLGVMEWLKSYVGEPKVTEIVYCLLNELRKDIFEKKANANDYHERVTLFKYVRWRFWCTPKNWCKIGWLVPFERSGYATRWSRTAFHVTDSGRNSEGVAGQAWSQQLTISVPHLPDITKGKRAVKEYASKTWISEQKVLEKKKDGMPRSIYAVPVMAGGKPWGVLVIDSRDVIIGQDEELDAAYKKIGRFLSEILKRI